MQKTTTLGVMTTGGDCAGLNATLAALAKLCGQRNISLIGIRGGTGGLMTSPPDVVPLTPETLDEAIIGYGGSWLGSINADAAKPETDQEADIQRQTVKNAVEALNLSALMIIGGDGSFRIAADLHHHTGIPMIGIPKTIDRDVGGTTYTLGFDSAVAENVRALSLLRATAGTHQRIMIAELMGRSHGHLALASGLSAMADAILIPECVPDFDHLCADLEKKQHQKSLLIVVAEGVQTLRGLSGGRLLESLADGLQNRFLRPTRTMVMGYLQRGAQPTAFERLMAIKFANHALTLFLSGHQDAVVIMDQHGSMGHLTLTQVDVAPIFFNQDHLTLAETMGISLGRKR